MEGPPISLTDPLQQLVTVPHFYLSFFGENDRQLYKDLATVMIKGCPKYA